MNLGEVVLPNTSDSLWMCDFCNPKRRRNCHTRNFPSNHIQTSSCFFSVLDTKHEDNARFPGDFTVSILLVPGPKPQRPYTEIHGIW